MPGIRRAIALFVAVVALTAGTLTSAQPASAAWDSCDLRVKVNELRGWDVHDKYNIIVWKATAKESIDLNGVVLSGNKEYTACDFGEGRFYHWAVFKSGDFVRKGDGGYRNWAFYGHWKRPTDKHVVFLPR